MTAWLRALLAFVERGEPTVLVTVASVEGSAPRGPGTKMLVTSEASEETIGGGQLEYQAIQRAREILEGGKRAVVLEDVPLGPQLGQCCGGFARLLFEVIDQSDLGWLKALSTQGGDAPAYTLRDLDSPDPRKLLDASDDNQLLEAHIEKKGSPTIFKDDTGHSYFLDLEFNPRCEVVVFGAGHVGRALVKALAPLDFKVTWVDGRENVFPNTLPAGVEALSIDPPHYAVERAGAGAFYLVMTHSHPLDLEVCEAVLRRGDAGYLGLIGSKSKRSRFLQRLAAKGLTSELLAGLTCPVGLPGIDGKEPAVIAASVAVDLLMRRSDALSNQEDEKKKAYV